MTQVLLLTSFQKSESEVQRSEVIPARSTAATRVKNGHLTLGGIFLTSVHFLIS